MMKSKLNLLLLIFLINLVDKINGSNDNAKLIESFLQLTPPLDLSNANGVSSICQQHTKFYIEAMKNFELWAMKIHDSSAKIPSGLLNGNINQLGDFDQCLSVTEPNRNFQGKYCLAYLQSSAVKDDSLVSNLKKETHKFEITRNEINETHNVMTVSTIVWGLCIPSSCSNQDLEIGLKNNLNTFTENTGLMFEVKVFEGMCYVKDDEWSSKIKLETKIALIFFISWILFVSLSTWYDIRSKLESDQKSSFLLAFSLKYNMKHLSMKLKSDEIKCAYGLRIVGMVVIYFGHSGFIFASNPVINKNILETLFDNPAKSVIMDIYKFNEMFLLLSGMLASYTLIKRLDDGKKIHYFKDIFGRLLRLLPSMLVVIIFMAFIYPHLGSGPQWHTMATIQSELCRNYWWRNLLFIQNYFGIDEMCLVHSHYLTTDMHMFLIIPVITYYLWKRPKETTFCVLGVVIAVSAARFYITYHNDLFEFNFIGAGTTDSKRNINLIYSIPILHFGFSAVGIYLGYFLRRCRETHFSKIKIIFGWIICFSLLLLSYFIPYKALNANFVYDRLEAAIHSAVGLFAWCLAVAWIIFITDKGHTNFLTKWLEWRGFVLISKFSYSFYLVQFLIFWYNAGTNRTALYMKSINDMISFTEICCTCLASLILTFFVEFPFLNLKKRLFSDHSLSKKVL